MPTLTEANFRAHLSEGGIYLGEATLEPEASFMVFSQTPSVLIDAPNWEQKTAAFLNMRFGLVVPKVYSSSPKTDAALVVVAEPEGQGTLRLIYGRSTRSTDLTRAQTADTQGAGMYELAKRCPTVWCIEASDEADRPSLAIAAIVAMVHLGPIVPPSGAEIFGIRTARLKLEQRRATP